jgi:signal recognition particle receptor subunit beta
MASVSIVVCGSEGAGKSSAIAALCGGEMPLVRAGGAAEADQQVDCGRLTFSDGESINVYGVREREKLNGNLDVLEAESLGLILLLDNSRPDPYEDLRYFLKAFEDLTPKAKLVIGITKTDMRPRPSVREYHRQLRGMQAGSYPIFEVDARVRRDMALLLQALLYSLDASRFAVY